MTEPTVADIIAFWNARLADPSQDAFCAKIHPDSLRAIIASNKALVEALRRYGYHLNDCPACRSPTTGRVRNPNVECSCGFDAALKAAGVK